MTLREHDQLCRREATQVLSPQRSVLPPVLVAVAMFEIEIEFAESLKDKRMVVRSIKDKLRNRFKISVNEVALHDVHQRARLAISFISLDHPNADAMLEKVQNFIEEHTDGVLAGWTSEKLEFDESLAF